MSIIKSDLQWHVIYSHAFNDLETLASFDREEQALKYINAGLSERDHTSIKDYVLIEGRIRQLKEVSRVKQVVVYRGQE